MAKFCDEAAAEAGEVVDEGEKVPDCYSPSEKGVEK